MPTLNWINRNESIAAAGKAAYRILEEEPQHGYGDDSPNMLVYGDNLEALKALLPYYAGQVKCIYIDPPYNTRSAFEHYDDNLEHSTWLQMMYPRLELLRELLREDGSIWVSIDDNEAHYLKVIMDEVFGRKNFVDTIIWQKIYTVKNSARYFSDMHDYILVMEKIKKSGTENFYRDQKNSTKLTPILIMILAVHGQQMLFKQETSTASEVMKLFAPTVARSVLLWELFGVFHKKIFWHW